MDTTNKTVENRSETQFSGDATSMEGNANKVSETNGEIKQTEELHISMNDKDMRIRSHATEKLNAIDENEEETYDHEEETYDHFKETPMTVNTNKMAVVIVNDVESEGAFNEKDEKGEGGICDNMFWKKWCRNGPMFCCRKYFWEGQLQRGSDTVQVDAGHKVDISPLKRKIIAILAPALLMNFFWWAVMIKKDLWHLFPETYFMSITMIFASMIGGMTSEGGGAIAFPVTTLAFGVKPSVARDFSVMIQSFGLSCAAFTLVFMKVHLEISALLWCSLGGSVGVIFGLELIDPNLTPPQKKMGFVSIWFSFAFALFLLNRNHKRPTFNHIQNMNWLRVGVLVITGFVGGCFTSFAGTGVDICSFSIITLLFRVSEKVATPTSVVLMAINSVVCFFWRWLIANEIETDAWEYLMVCIPIVVFGAPFGSLLGSHFHRLVLAACIYVIDTVALVSAFAIVPQTPFLTGVSVGIILFGFLVFFVLTTIGQKMIMTKEMESLIARKQQNLVKGKFHSEVSIITTEIEKPISEEIKRRPRRFTLAEYLAPAELRAKARRSSISWLVYK